MSHLLKVAFVFGIFILAVALFGPSLIEAGETDAEETVRLSAGESAALTDRLNLTADSVSNADSNATVTLQNTQTFEENSTTIDEGQNATLELSGDDVTVSVDSISSSDVATMTVTYPPMFGWDSGPRTFYENIGLLVALLAMAMLMGILKVVML